MILPVKNFNITSKYGARILNGKREFHTGIDFTGNPLQVYSILSGLCVYDFDKYIPELAFTAKEHSGGNMIIIQSEYAGHKYYIRYLHLVNNAVSMGDKILEGQVIGVYGDVGKSFGAHLHIDAYNDKWIKINITELFKQEGLL